MQKFYKILGGAQLSSRWILQSQNNGKYKLVAENNQGKIIKLEKALEYRLR